MCQNDKTQYAEKQYEECYVAFLDVLGFKNIIGEKSCDYISHIFSTIHSAARELQNYDYIHLNTNALKQLRIKVMSDSICIFVNRLVDDALPTLLVSCALLQAQLLHCMPDPILLRGAVTCGGMSDQGEVIYGPGLTHAYLMETNNAKTPRIIFTKALFDMAIKQYANDSNSLKLLHHLAIWEPDAFYALNYFTLFTTLDGDGADRDKLKHAIENTLSTTTDTSIREKYLYLKAMFSKYCE